MPEKILLFSDIDFTETPGTHEIPLGLLAIATTLSHAGYDHTIVDAQIEPDWRDRLVEVLPEARLFGVSSLTGPSITAVLEAIGLARSIAPDVPIVWGGYHATLAYASIFSEGWVDYIIRGYGEEAIVALTSVLRDNGWPGHYGGDDLATVPSLVWQRDNRLVVNERGALPDVNALPPLDYDLVDVSKYLSSAPGATGVWGDLDMKVLPYITSYGCPQACTFCAEPEHSERRWRGLDPERVAREFRALSEKYDVRRIGLNDPDFTANPHRVIAIVHELLKHKLDVQIFPDARARDIVVLARRLELRDFKAAGFTHCYLGLESGSDRMLRKIRKGSTVQDAVRASQILSAAGIQFYTSFIHDFPDESDADSEETLALAELVASLPGNSQSHHFFVPYPMTQAFNELLEGSALDPSRFTQRDWAQTSTFWANVIWPGRSEFRQRVVQRLYQIHERYPEALPRDRIPVDIPYTDRVHSLAERLKAGRDRRRRPELSVNRP